MILKRTEIPKSRKTKRLNLFSFERVNQIKNNKKTQSFSFAKIAKIKKDKKTQPLTSKRTVPDQSSSSACYLYMKTKCKNQLKYVHKKH